MLCQTIPALEPDSINIGKGGTVTDEGNFEG